MRKSFFQERTEAQIRSLKPKKFYLNRGLVKAISDLGSEESIEIRTRLLPGNFYSQSSPVEASRKFYKHGNLVQTVNPKSQKYAYSHDRKPVSAEDFSFMENMNEEDVNYVGYSFYPVQGNDKRKRAVPFVWLLEGARIFTYSEKLASIEVSPYEKAERVEVEGASVVCTVPSREKKKGRYKIKLEHVPVVDSKERLAVVLSLKSDFYQEHKEFNIRYTYKDDRESSDIFTFYPQDIAAYIAVMKYFSEKDNFTPFCMNPFILPSRKEAEFYNRLCNNVIVYDASGKDRKLHIAEKSILLGRFMNVFGYESSTFKKERDVRLSDYLW